MRNGFSCSLCLLLISACSSPGKMNFSVSADGIIHSTTKTDTFLEKLLSRDLVHLKSVLDNRDSYQLQVIYTQIDRDAKNKPSFTDFYFNVNAARYFYPASTVKLPVAFLALQRVHELKKHGVGRNSTMVTENAYSGQTSTYNDPTSPDGRPTVERYIKKIFLVSDDNAYNRLYEFLGQEYINRELHRKGYKDAEIIHRLSIALTEDENRHTNPVSFYDSTSRKLYEQPMMFNTRKLYSRKELLGKGYYAAGELKSGPMNFSRKNRLCIESLHYMLRSILFPASVPAGSRFKIPGDEYGLVWKYMSELPAESRFPRYETLRIGDTDGKFLLFGSERKKRIPANIRVFNKVGAAYGFLVDVAYIVDFDKKIEFMISAVIYCNGDGILNDDKYEYDTVGFPFMKRLGELIYDYELGRERKYVPDLSQFRLKYD